MPTAGEIIERSGSGWALCFIYGPDPNAGTLACASWSRQFGAKVTARVDSATPAEARTLAAAIGAAAQRAEEREGKHDTA